GPCNSDAASVCLACAAPWFAIVPLVVHKLTCLPDTCCYNKDGTGLMNPSITGPASSPAIQSSSCPYFCCSLLASDSFKTGITHSAPSDNAAVIEVVA